MLQAIDIAIVVSFRASARSAVTPSCARGAGWIARGTIAIQWIAQINADGGGYLAQRTMACRSDRDARNAGSLRVFPY
jgi:hypothetical protein